MNNETVTCMGNPSSRPPRTRGRKPKPKAKTPER